MELWEEVCPGAGVMASTGRPGTGPRLFGSGLLWAWPGVGFRVLWSGCSGVGLAWVVRTRLPELLLLPRVKDDNHQPPET